MTEDEMVGWHHQLDGHEFEGNLRVGDGQGGLACCNSWGHKELDTTEQLNSTEGFIHFSRLSGAPLLGRSVTNVGSSTVGGGGPNG